MYLSREEMHFDFRGARFELASSEDRKLLGWVFNQFLYGEVTGIQCGYWLFRAPHLNAAAFLAKQAGEEMSHVKRILRILNLLHESASLPHPAIKFLSTGMMGGSWGEHVALEMALGEGLVLHVFYAMEQTIDDPEIKKILRSAFEEEESHVRFGETETKAWLEKHPTDRNHLLTQAWIQVVALRFLKRFVLKKLLANSTRSGGHPVLSQFGEFYDHVIRNFETRIQRLGLSSVPVSKISLMGGIARLFLLPWYKFRSRFIWKHKPLTGSYLEDPVVLKEALRTSAQPVREL